MQKTTLKVALCLLVSALVSNSWAAKSPELDLAKTLETQSECQRIADWRLLGNLHVDCGQDNQHFYSHPSATMVSENAKVSIGNFNLLHPGTDKTLFKDFGLVADLINGQFDLMAGLELVEVLADGRANNLKIQTGVQEKYQTLTAAQALVQRSEEQIKLLEKKIHDASANQINTSIVEQTLLALRGQLESVQQRSAEQDHRLREIERSIQLNRRPGLTLFGWEVFKQRRLVRLSYDLQRKEKLIRDMQSMKLLKDNLVSELARWEAIGQTTATVNPEDGENLAHLKSELPKLSEDLQNKQAAFALASKEYRIPGYLQLLLKLQELDSSWSLILTPHGDAQEESNTQEMVGYFYRASRLRPQTNPHCRARFQRDSSACYPNLYADFMGSDSANLFSRRPFLASFKSSEKSFTFLASHVIFEAPKSDATRKNMIQQAFGVEDVAKLGQGITKANFARFVEVKMMLNLVEKLKDDALEDIIVMGDFNLEGDNPFWQKLLPSGLHLLIQEKTSLSVTRFTQGKETHGVSSNYDHFLVNDKTLRECTEYARVNFLQGTFAQKVKNKYLVREEADKGPYLLSSDAENKIAMRMSEMESRLLDKKNLVGDLGKFKERVFDSQTSDETYYNFFQQLISDHLPIRMDCQ
ncbi:MAG: hypothetical protein A2X86_01480 [Bdellovibrionales bacterium GWA2_49_15]|nr:MAG: hypothetical protein A2X86_01480 [Bdellovibrionales bacterium GWA2_49_15]